MNKILSRPLLLAAALTAAACNPTQPDAATEPAKADSSTVAADEVLVRFADGVDEPTAERIIDELGASTVERLEPQLYRLRLPAGLVPAEAIERLQTQPQVSYAEPNIRHRPYLR